MKKRLIVLLTALFILNAASFVQAAVNNKFFRADKQSFDVETGMYTITGNIVINVGSAFITGDKALVKLSTLEFFGNGGWFLKQDDVTFKGKNVYVIFNKSIAMIDGDTDFQRSNLQITADKVDYNWKSKIAEFKGNVRVKQEGAPPDSRDLVKYNLETNEFVN